MHILKRIAHAAKTKTKIIVLLVAISLLISQTPLITRAATCPCSIWPSTATPAQETVVDNQGVELGVKFTSDISGSITGIRFYKGPQNTGTHTGSLWNAGGTRLATATFTNETGSGWQQVSFATPVNVAANTTYTASYFAPVGFYSANNSYFTAATDSPPLHALAGGNGVYHYGGGFPTTPHQDTNYWVDVVFSDTTVPDNTPPTVTAVSPSNNATNAPLSTNVSATFSEPLNPATVTSSFELRNASNTLMPAAVSYDANSYTATLNPNSDLTAGATYTATVKGSLTGIKDTAGNPMASNYTWSFKAATPTILDQGPGGPILIITSGTRPFSKYYAEILHAEGLSSFATADISSITSTVLNQYDVVVVGEVPLTSAQVTLLTNWVTAGGNLMALRPDKKLANLLGLTDLATTLSDGYLLTNTTTAPGAGIVNQTIQYHGAADKYTAKAGTSTIATLYSNETAATSNPAVTVRSVGSAGGQAAAFTYDLARSIVYTRQGNPAWAGDERDGASPIRSDDLFYGAKAGDVQPDYVNLNKVAIPQADEQQRLLSNIVGYMNQDKKPVPKLWYLPKGNKAVVVMAGDDHGTQAGTKNSFDYLKVNSPANCSVANWECYRSTSWIYTNSSLTSPEALAYQNEGFDIGVHVNAGCSDWTPTSLATAYTNDLAAFRAKYAGLPNQQGHRVHCIAWSDWATQPKVELANGMRMDLNYYYWPGAWVQNRPGFFTGSGIPMRFADLDGTMIDVYQEPSHLVNESGMSFPQAINTQLDRALGPEGYYGAFGTHYDFSDAFDQQLVQSAKARGVPLVSAQQLLDWTDARNASYFKQMAWSGSTLNFASTIDARAGTMMRGMLPVSSVKGTLQSITKTGTGTVSYTTEVIKGVQYAMFPVTTDSYSAVYATDTTTPTVTTTSPLASASAVDPAANVTATFSEPMNAATIGSTTFELRNASNAVVPAAVTYNAITKTAILDPTASLAAGATYTATVRGGTTDPRVKDVAGNALASNKTWSFVTASGPVCPCSLWPGSAAPTTNVAADTGAVELGLKFIALQPGKITGIRFYKGFDDVASHTVKLWNTAGVAIGTATTASETATGWQTATFTTPVNVTANTVYIASYFAPIGRYPFTANYFTSTVTNGPLQTAAATGNGVFLYGGGFPTNSVDTNYWVDVVYIP